MRLPRGLRALGHRDFRLFWAGQLVSMVGTWMQSVGQAWLVLELTNSPFRLGLIGTLQWGPLLLFASFGGAVSDRLPKRRVILATQATLMVQAFTLAALVRAGHVQYWHVAVMASVYGLANALDMPTRQSYLVELVGKDDLLNAIALNSAVFNAARVLGPAAAGLLVARSGPAAAFALNGSSFLAVILALRLIRTEGLPRPRTGASLLQDVLEGVRYAARTPRIALILGLVVSVSLFAINHNVVVPLLAREVLREGAHGFGLLMAALGTGAVAGALALAAVRRDRPPLAMVLVSALVVSGTTLGLAAARQFWVAAAALGVIGFAQIVFMASCHTTVQVTVPDELRGRLMGLYTLAFVGVTPIGSFLVGTVAEHLGVPAACALGGGAGLVAVTALALVARRP